MVTLPDAPLVGFLPSTELKRSKRFFAETLGIPLRERTAYALVFDAAGTELKVSRLAERGVASSLVHRPGRKSAFCPWPHP